MRRVPGWRVLTTTPERPPRATPPRSPRRLRAEAERFAPTSPDHRAARAWLITLPGWLDAVAKVLPLTHTLALFRYGLTSASGAQALHNIWGMSNVTVMAGLSLAVICAYALVAFGGAVRLFTKAGTS
jgi:hypothetical protein